MTILQAIHLPQKHILDCVIPIIDNILNQSFSATVLLAPHAPIPPMLGIGDHIDDSIALVINTSGTTGPPKGALLTRDALIASGERAHQYLGGPGQWILALPAHHIAGFSVIFRSVLAGMRPISMDLTQGFRPEELVQVIHQLGPHRRYISLVSNQLAKALHHHEARTALRDMDAILLGGGPAPLSLLEEANRARLQVVCTYGMSETSGGCIYNGVPLPDVQIRIGPDHRIHIGGPTLASGYRNPVTPDPFQIPGWFITNDVGHIDPQGHLQIHGRIDDLIMTGGLAVMPTLVEEVLLQHPHILEAAVFGVADHQLGYRVVAAIVPASNSKISLSELRDHVGHQLGRYAAPQEIHLCAKLPYKGIGKIDRQHLIQQYS